jgi:hypothetical protein
VVDVDMWTAETQKELLDLVAAVLAIVICWVIAGGKAWLASASARAREAAKQINIEALEDLARLAIDYVEQEATKRAKAGLDALASEEKRSAAVAFMLGVAPDLDETTAGSVVEALLKRATSAWGNGPFVSAQTLKAKIDELQAKMDALGGGAQ